MKIALVVGARPNFVKAVAILKAAEKFPKLEFDLIHLGQHRNIMSDPYFRDLRLPEPEFCFGPYHGDSVMRLGAMVENLAREVLLSGDYRPDAVMVVGDADATLAGALAAAKCDIPVIHVEAGMRNNDFHMQEELNRRFVDSVAAQHYCNSRQACKNLWVEGKQPKLVGNVMVDTLYRFLPEALSRYPKRPSSYAVLTLHRAELVDNYKKYEGVIDAIAQISLKIPVIWPRHPRCPALGAVLSESIIQVEAMGYLEFISMMAHAKFVMTDSGGVQEETTALGVKCFTLRENTERPETITEGSNVLVGTDPARILHAVEVFGEGDVVDFPKPKCWDGHAAERILEDLCATL